MLISVYHIRINYRNAVSDEQQDSIQQLENRIRSGGKVYLV